ncbi:MAG: hypothetical protein LBR60_02480 [Fibrobacter sp.]|jgi:hypothetical protein|nr:hypothetical protein [Fibrobacter sp.]
MLKKGILFLCMCVVAGFAQDDENIDNEAVEAEVVEPVQESRSADDRAQRRQFEEDQRADEFANSLRRRDWLKDRLILEIGAGSRSPVWGESGLGMGFGFGAEYITRWHAGLYASFGFVPSGTDTDFDYISLEGGTGWKVGLNYYLFPKDQIHLGLSVSYGTVYYDHNILADESNGYMRELIMLNGFQFDALVTYLTDAWYFLQFSVGFYYAPDAKEKSFRTTTDGKELSKVVNKDGIPDMGIVFGVTIGFAFPEFFPDDTEVRRREREERYNE